MTTIPVMTKEDGTEPCPWDWATALRKACEEAQADGYRYRVFAYPSPISPTGFAWTYRAVLTPVVRSRRVHWW